MENQNSVAYVGKIGSVVEIPGADNIELVLVGGWQAITKKGEYKVDDLVVVATTDAVIPKELSDQLGVTNYLRKGQRVRTVKLRKVYSECLIVSLNQVFKSNMSAGGFVEGQDMMETLGITKYEPPAKVITLVSGGRKVKYHQNPNFKVYYKFPNQKNVPDMFSEEDEVVITRKLHGTNARYGIVRKKKLSLWDRVKMFFGNEWAGFEYVYGSHNVEKGSDSQGFYDTDVWKTVANKYDIRGKLWDHVKDTYEPSDLTQGVVIYGEIYGAGIQKNYEYGLTDVKFVGFDVEVDGVYQPYINETVHFDCLQLPQVELLYQGNWNKEEQDKFVFSNFIEGTKVPHEGVVVKSVTGARNKVSKVINPDYLIYGEKNNVGDSH
jgi:RNA ligase (TIGR02306 family)